MRRFSRQERGPADLVASAVTANFPRVIVVVLRLQSVSPFTTHRFQDAATPVLLLPLKRRPSRQRSPHPPHRQNDFTCGLYVRSTDHRTGEGFTGHDSGPFSPGGDVQHPQGFFSNNRILAGEKVVRIDPRCFTQGRRLAHPEGRNAVSRSLPAWLLRRRPLSGPPGGTTLAAYLR
jgi:hypothetical protein